MSGWQAINCYTAGVVKLLPDSVDCIICDMKSGHSPQVLAEHKIVSFLTQPTCCRSQQLLLLCSEAVDARRVVKACCHRRHKGSDQSNTIANRPDTVQPCKLLFGCSRCFEHERASLTGETGPKASMCNWLQLSQSTRQCVYSDPRGCVTHG